MALRAGKRAVLIVDDNRDSADTLAELVSALGHDTTLAYDGRGALDMARLAKPDMVLLDLGLPGLDGFEVAAALRREFGDAIRIVAVTGSGRDSDRDRAREAGFDQVLLKPLEIAFLKSLLGSGRSPRV